MTGPEHFAAAQKLVAAANEQLANVTADTFDCRLLAVKASMATAQVHATLALVAATAEAGGLSYKTVTKTSAWWTALHGEARS